MNSKREAPPREEEIISEPLMVPTPIEEERLDDLLSNDEIEEIRARARKKVADEDKKERANKFYEAALNDARRAAGIMDPAEEYRQEMAEQVRVFIDLPRLRKAAGGELAPDPIIIDQRMFVAGQVYEVERGLAIYLYYLMDQARRHVNAVDGRSRTYYNGSAMIYQGGQALGGPTGPSFDAIHRRPQ